MFFTSETIHKGGSRVGTLEADCLCSDCTMILAGCLTLGKKIHLNFLLPLLPHLQNACSSNITTQRITAQRILIRNKSKELIRFVK